jgi:uncharacterized protein YkwD
MKNILYLLVFIGLLSCTPKLATRKTAPVTARNEVGSRMEESILDYINEYRHSKGLSSLKTLDIATQQAYMHSKDMATGRAGFGHGGFEQRVQVIRQNLGVSYISASAENVAEGQMSAKEVVEGWLNSSGHRHNIEGNYTLTGIGIYKSREGDLYFTQIFLRK